MNRVIVLCPEAQFQQIVDQIIDSLKFLKYFSDAIDSRTVRIENKYFRTLVSFKHTDDGNLQTQPADGYILFTKPVSMPSNEIREDLAFVAAKIDNESEEGKYDVSDWTIDYFISIDEVGDIIGMAPFSKIEGRRDDGAEQQQSADDLDVDGMIEEIQDPVVRQETVRMKELFGRITNDADDSTALDSIFGRLETFQSLLRQASEQDRKNAAAVVALYLGREAEK